MTVESFTEFERTALQTPGIARIEDLDERPDGNYLVVTYKLYLSADTIYSIDKQLQESDESKTLEGLKRTLYDKGVEAIDYNEPTALIVEVSGPDSA